MDAIQIPPAISVAAPKMSFTSILGWIVALVFLYIAVRVIASAWKAGSAGGSWFKQSAPVSGYNGLTPLEKLVVMEAATPSSAV